MFLSGRFKRPLFTGITFVFAVASGSPLSLGIFDSQGDIGTVLHRGGASYDPSAKSYTVSGSGENMWFAADDFHFVWKKVTDENVSLAAGMAFLGAEGDHHRKAVLMIRQSLDPDSIYADAALHGDGLTSLQFRDAPGAATHEIESNTSAPQRLCIRKRDDRFYLWIANRGQDFQFAGGSVRIPIKAPFFMGIGVCAHNKDEVQSAVFSNLEFDTKLAGPATKVSTIETVAVASTDARVTLVSTDQVTAPEFSSDGTSITFHAGSIVKRVSANGGMPETLSAPPSVSGNRQSPDGRFVATLSKSNEGMELSVTSNADNSTKTIARFSGDDGSLSTNPWSPDSKRLTFVSYQTVQ